MSVPPVEPADTRFDPALSGMVTRIRLSDGRHLPMLSQRWNHRAGGEDRWLLRRCHGSTLDLGCGPGRLVEGLFARGTPALGVDCSAFAVRHCHTRGVPALRRDLFRPLPAEGHWRHVVLADGNIGIGGDPALLLLRAASLLRADGSVLVEAAGPRCGLWRGEARVSTGGGWFPWALLGLDALADLAHRAGLQLLETHSRRRHFGRLTLR